MRIITVISLFTSVYCVVDALRCYQGSTPVNVKTLPTLVTCQQNSWSCTKVTDSVNVNRACNFQNCTAANLMYSSTDVCTNTTFSENCCCYTDGCNSAPSLVWNLSLIFGILGSCLWIFGSDPFRVNT